MFISTDIRKTVASEYIVNGFAQSVSSTTARKHDQRATMGDVSQLTMLLRVPRQQRTNEDAG
jgi:hypothetical protein